MLHCFICKYLFCETDRVPKPLSNIFFFLFFFVSIISRWAEVASYPSCCYRFFSFFPLPRSGWGPAANFFGYCFFFFFATASSALGCWDGWGMPLPIVPSSCILVPWAYRDKGGYPSLLLLLLLPHAMVPGGWRQSVALSYSLIFLLFNLKEATVWSWLFKFHCVYSFYKVTVYNCKHIIIWLHVWNLKACFICY